MVAERDVLFQQRLRDIRRLRFNHAPFAVNQNGDAFVGGTTGQKGNEKREKEEGKEWT
ncbi:MAG: hypothetical protein BroJett039_05470 [Chloroflexota bacterium]|nr:MAG: hypothetical protein BroJett039_05470 [Chloroflexota bacterium]